MAAAREIKVPRQARLPIALKGAEVKIDGQNVAVKGKIGEVNIVVHPSVTVSLGEDGVRVQPSNHQAAAMSGTMHSLINGAVSGVNNGFVKKLQLVGVGYRAAAKGKVLNLALGFSHPVVHPVPEGLTVETPTPTEIIVRGANKQVLGQFCAEVRAYRPPEPYKGKGIRYSDEYVLRKEAKKK
jgi:large subunit ribosomal protein L6